MRIAFDLDETLGIPLIEGTSVTGWQLRTGADALLTRLSSTCELCLWSVSSRGYVDKALSFGLDRWFEETYSWDEMPTQWKDVRQLAIDLLVDDTAEYRERALEHSLGDSYVVVPAYGSPEDLADTLAWVRLVEEQVRCLVD